MVRSVMSNASLPIFFKGYALETTQYILNLVPSKEQRVFVSTNAHFLEEDYIIDNKPRSKSFI